MPCYMANPRLLVILGVVIGFGGIKLLVGPWQESLRWTFRRAGLSSSALLWAGGSILAKRRPAGSPPLGTAMKCWSAASRW